MPDKPKIYFTRDEELVYLRTNPHFRAYGKEPLDIKIGPGNDFLEFTYETLWDAGAGIIQTESKTNGKITEISEDQNDQVYIFLSSGDSCVWDHQWINDPCMMIPFKRDYETSINKALKAQWGSEHFYIIDDSSAVWITGGENSIQQFYDHSLDGWRENSEIVGNLLFGCDDDDPWDIPYKSEVREVSEEEMDAHIAKFKKEAP